MSASFEQFAATNKAAIDSMLSVANTALTAAERIATLNLETARNMLGDSTTTVNTVLGATDAQSALAAQHALVQPAIEKSMAYSKSLYNIANDAQSEVAQLFQAQVAEFKKASDELVNKLLKNAPAGSEALVKAMQDALQKANAAVGTATAMTQQLADAAQTATAAVAKKSK